jgi:DNA-directed RNA polymerase subunit N (RpoN/RPB10)
MEKITRCGTSLYLVFTKYSSTVLVRKSEEKTLEDVGVDKRTIKQTLRKQREH